MMEKTSKEYFVRFSYLIRLDSGKLSKSTTSTLTLRENTEKLRNLNSPNLSTISSQSNQKVKDFKVWKSTEKTTICNSWQKLFSISAWKIMIVLSYFSKRRATFKTDVAVQLSIMDQELMMLELRYKQYAEDFNGINTFQMEKVLVAKKRWT